MYIVIHAAKREACKLFECVRKRKKKALLCNLFGASGELRFLNDSYFIGLPGRKEVNQQVVPSPPLPKLHPEITH